MTGGLEYRPDGIYRDGEFVVGYNEWEAACPGCGRFHHRYVPWGEGWKCVACGWCGMLRLVRS